MTPARKLTWGVLRPGPTGIPAFTTCVVCGVQVKQPGNGRPRLLCRKVKCTRARQHELRHRPPAELKWNVHDWVEALNLWRHSCALCGVQRFHLVPLYTDGILPVCSSCNLKPPDERALRWASRCKPGCPLPNPFAGGAR